MSLRSAPKSEASDGAFNGTPATRIHNLITSDNLISGWNKLLPGPGKAELKPTKMLGASEVSSNFRQKYILFPLNTRVQVDRPMGSQGPPTHTPTDTIWGQKLSSVNTPHTSAPSRLWVPALLLICMVQINYTL